MQLEPQEDNRDGLAIRLMTEELQNETKNKIFTRLFGWGTSSLWIRSKRYCRYT